MDHIETSGLLPTCKRCERIVIVYLRDPHRLAYVSESLAQTL